jgi:hypothetical protein
MNIVAEKKEIIKRITEEQDEFVIHAIKEMLDAAKVLHDHDPELDKELSLAIKEADNGQGRPHDEVWAEVRKRYGL